MEYRDLNRTVTLRVKKICCEEFQKKLKKELLKQRGVYSVEINPEKNVVVVRGTVDPDSLVHLVARTGKQAKIVCNNYQQNYTHHHSNTKEEEHKCEDYVAFDEGMHRDYVHSWRPATHFSSIFGHFPHYAGGCPFQPAAPPGYCHSPGSCWKYSYSVAYLI